MGQKDWRQLELSTSLPPGQLGSLIPQQVRLWLTSFPRGQAFLRGLSSPIYSIPNWLLTLPPAGKLRGFSPGIYCGILGKLLEVNLTILWVLLWLGPPEFLILKLFTLSLQQFISYSSGFPPPSTSSSSGFHWVSAPGNLDCHYPSGGLPSPGGGSLSSTVPSWFI